jgi:hypothetical protein
MRISISGSAGAGPAHLTLASKEPSAYWYPTPLNLTLFGAGPAMVMQSSGMLRSTVQRVFDHCYIVVDVSQRNRLHYVRLGVEI